MDGEGNLLVADCENHCIRKVSSDGTVSTLAGSREHEEGHEDGPAAEARFSEPLAVAADEDGNVVVAETYAIRKISPDGVVSTLAGSRDGTGGSEDGAAADARFEEIYDLAITAEGDVLVADYGNSLVRKITNTGLGRGVAVPRWSPGAPSLSRDLLAMLADERFADATFDVGGTRITAHRSVLAARSEYFERMFSSQCRAPRGRLLEPSTRGCGTVGLPRFSAHRRAFARGGTGEAQPGAIISQGDTTPEAFRRLLAFLYSDELQLDDDVVVDVMRKAQAFVLTRAYNLCMRYCVRHVAPANAIAWLVRADACALDDLRGVALGFVKRAFRTIREQQPQTLDQLRAHPDLMLEVMTVAL